MARNRVEARIGYEIRFVCSLAPLKAKHAGFPPKVSHSLLYLLSWPWRIGDV